MADLEFCRFDNGPEQGALLLTPLPHQDRVLAGSKMSTEQSIPTHGSRVFNEAIWASEITALSIGEGLQHGLDGL
ncbi:hypothetical protein PRZ48_005254 [Zasmidium cellare]|uniref:Uncharacterized protein n=1 Tax=Zasmidium cellare TaxID=395010 RepID=A0ABR0EU32_ZASCE|nr:hypothetical protein PRZ48_005254 [Zasmidium cellare]